MAYIKHDFRADKERVSNIETGVKELILAVAEVYEWDSWVNIETVITVKEY